MRIEVYDTLPSTNEAALTRARAGERGPLWITAVRQTAGRGRRGRVWVSDPGNLHATLLLTDPAPARRTAELSFVAALAVHDAVVAVAPDLRARTRIKWPNDLLIDGAKVAGILIEGEGGAGRPLAVAVGIGINCAHHPTDVAFPATDLDVLGLSVGPQDVLAALSGAMIERLAQWGGGSGFAAIRSDWLERATGRGADIRVVLGGEEIAGRFETLDESGRLMLRLADATIRTISAGDVFPLLTVRADAS